MINRLKNIEVGDLVRCRPIPGLDTVTVWPHGINNTVFKVPAGTIGSVTYLNKQNGNMEVCTMGHICQTVLERWVALESWNFETNSVEI